MSLALEQFVNSNIEGANLYLLSHLQTEVVSSEVMLVCLAALVTCFLATLYPAYRASCIQPAKCCVMNSLTQARVNVSVVLECLDLSKTYTEGPQCLEVLSRYLCRLSEESSWRFWEARVPERRPC